MIDRKWSASLACGLLIACGPSSSLPDLPSGPYAPFHFGSADPSQPTPTPSAPEPSPSTSAPPVVRSGPGRIPGLSGGTLLVLKGSGTVVVADAERDRLVFFDLGSRRITGELLLSTGDEPGRSVEHNGYVSTVLRGSGEIVSYPIANPQHFTRRSACPMPRGIAFHQGTGRLLVACAGGELMRFTANDSGDGTLLARLPPDLRDVVITRDATYVTRFRSAELLQIDPSHGKVIKTIALGSPPIDPDPSAPPTLPPLRAPTVAWSAIADPDGQSVIVVHQQAGSANLSPTPGGYGENAGLCAGRGSGVVSAVTKVTAGVSKRSVGVAGAVLPVDVAPTARGLVVVGAANRALAYLDDNAVLDQPVDGATGGPLCLPQPGVPLPAQPVAVAVDDDQNLIVQGRDPPTLMIGPVAYPLGGTPSEDVGHTLFHMDSGGGLACASCHPEGGDDGHVWNFTGIGPRRTQNLSGGLSGSAPFHWSGDMADFSTLVHEVFTSRMLGPELRSEEQAAILSWLDKVPAPRPSAPVDAQAARRGKSLFERGAQSCVSCHAGSKLGRSRRDSVDVGTGEAFQVPSLLGIAQRAPFMHDGCAKTLRDRFESCGGGDAHGTTSPLAASQISDLVAYLESL